MNNKGFMMAEVVVVSSIILIALVGLYASYNKIFSIYNQRIDYYDVSTLYELADFKKVHAQGVDSAASLDQLCNEEEKKVYFVMVSELSLLVDELEKNSENITFRDYVSFLDTSLDRDKFEEEEVNNILVMEKCVELDNCKYAYLEVYD